MGNARKYFQSDGAVKFSLPDHSVDRVIATYVLDLLPVMGVGDFIKEADRDLGVEGKLCLVSLTTAPPASRTW